MMNKIKQLIISCIFYVKHLFANLKDRIYKIDKQNDLNFSPIIIISNIIIYSYRISAVWIIKKVIEKFSFKNQKLIMQNITDLYVIIRCVIPIVLLVLSKKSAIYLYLNWYLLLEMIIAFFSHFLSDNYNTAGPGKIIAVRRSILIVFIGFITAINIFAYMYSYYLDWGLIDSLYYSTTNIISPIFIDFITISNKQKILSIYQALVGLFFLTYAIALIISFIKQRKGE